MVNTRRTEPSRFPLETHKRKTFRALVGAALVFAFTFVSTGVASADRVRNSERAKTSEYSYCQIWWMSDATVGNEPLDSVGWAIFTSHGEGLEILDREADGKGIYVRIKYTLGSSTYYDHVYSFSGPSNNFEERDYDLPEGTLVDMRACQTNDGNHSINCRDANIQA
jgi:hypothetical protein